MFVIDKNGVILDVNSGKEDELYVPPDVFLNKNVTEVLPPSLAAEFKTAVNNTLAGNTTAPIQYKLPIKEKLADFEVRFTCFGDNKVIALVSNISSRKQTEAALMDSEEKLRNLVNSQTNYVIRTDLEGKHTYWNRKYEEDFGWIYKEKGFENGFALTSICDYHHNRTLDTVVKCLEKPGEIIKVELDKPHFISGVRTTLWEFVCLTDANNVPIEIQCMGIDITDRKLAEQQLRQSEEKYKVLFFDSPDGYLIIRDGQFIECNKASEKLIGGNRSQIIGCTPGKISPEFQPNGRNSFDYSHELMKETFEKGKNSFEWLHKRFDGTEVHFQINLTAIEYEGEKVLFTTWRDITERRKAEEKLRKLSLAVEQSPVSIFITNLDGNIEYVNPKASQTTGYTAEELIGNNPRVLKSGETVKTEYDELWGNISIGKEWHGIFHNKKKNGELYWESSTISPILDADGKITHYLAIKEDITEHRKFQIALQESQERFTQIAEISQTMIFETDANGLFTYVSPIVAKILGVNPDQIINKFHFFDAIPEDFREKATELYEKRELILQFICPMMMANQKLIWVEVNSAPVFDKTNNFLGFRGGVNDITERKLAEEELLKFRTISDQSNYGNAISDLNGNLIYSNDAFAQMHGYEVADLVGHHLSMLHNEQQMIRVNKALDILKKQSGFVTEEVWRTRKDGSAFPSLMNAKIIFDSKNKPLYLSASAIDITEIKESENLIRKSEENLNYAQILAKMGSWEFDMRTGEVSWSKNYYHLLGIDPSQPPLNLEEIKQRIHPEDRDLFESKLHDISNSHNLESIYFRLLKPDGHIRWIQANMVPKFENDQLVSISGVSIDITDKKEDAEKIRQQNIRLNAIIDAMPDLIFVSDRDGNYLEYFSPDSEDLLYPKEKLVGANLKDVFDATTTELHLKKINECLQQKKLISYEYSSSKNGKQQFFEARIVSLDEKRVLRFVRDITERKMQEKQIRKLNLAVEQSPVSIAITDLDANIEYINPAFVRSSGYPREELIGRNTRILKSDNTDISTYKNLWSTIIQGKTWNGEWINKKKNGELYWESVSISPIFDETGTITNYLALKQDITERKNAEKEIRDLNMNLEQKIKQRTIQLMELNDSLVIEIDVRKRTESELIKAKGEAEEANLAKSEFLSRMSHELRTPLNSILGFAQLLEMGELNTSQSKGVKHILRSGKHLLDLINEVLDISRIESGHIALSLEPVQVGSVIIEMIDIVKPLATYQQVTIDLVSSQDNYLFISADRQRFKQVMLNLLNNAIKYNHQNGMVVVKSEADPEFIRISVTDTGLGISEENLSRIFTPFERIGAEKTTTEGTGLGLAVVKKLMEAMGGSIGINSVLGEGTTFWIEFPTTKSQLEIVETTIGQMKTEPDKNNFKGLILYIEDNISNIELVEQVLINQRPGIRLISNTSGMEIVKLATEFNPDLILLDLNLPDMHGSEVLELIQADPTTKPIPVIVISADAMPHQLEKIMKLGAKDYLTKPSDVFSFLKVVDLWINKKG
jgi:PAS domain S-box-containing protein